MGRKKETVILKTFRLDAKLVKLFIATAQMRDQTMRSVLEKAIREYVNLEKAIREYVNAD